MVLSGSAGGQARATRLSLWAKGSSARQRRRRTRRRILKETPSPALLQKPAAGGDPAHSMRKMLAALSRLLQGTAASRPVSFPGAGSVSSGHRSQTPGSLRLEPPGIALARVRGIHTIPGGRLA